MTHDGEPSTGISREIVGSSRGRARPRSARAACLLAALVIALATLVAGARPASAGAFELNDSGWEGGSELLEIARAEIGAARVHPVAVLNWDELTPEDGVLAIHPLVALDEGDSAAFMKAGGRLAILDDYGRGDETLTRFHIDRIPPPSRPVSALRNKPQLAIAEPVVDVVAGHSGGPHPVVSHVQQLVTNHPMGLRHPNLSPVLRIRAIGEPDVVIAVAGQVGRGRLFAMSDPSATINEMLRYPGNRAFVSGLVRYLVDDDGAVRRQGRLFIVANRFGQEGSFGGEGTIRKDFDSMLKAVASALAEARADGFPGWAHVLVAALAALGLAAWVARASARPYKSPLPRYARPNPLVAQGGVAGRFAVLAAPTSPRSLALLELKSAFYEAMTHKLALSLEPPVDALAKLALKAGRLDPGTHGDLLDVLQQMHDVEAAVVAGRPASVSAAALARASAVVQKVLAACGADGSAAQPPPPRLYEPALAIERDAEPARETEGDHAG
jgi:hypothetical protein